MPPNLSLPNTFICTRCRLARRVPASASASISTTSAASSTPRLSTARRQNLSRAFILHQRRAYASVPPPPPSPSGYTSLSHRGLILLFGPDAAHLLHGITTSSVRTPSLSSNAQQTPSTGAGAGAGAGAGFYSAFLNAQGRILFDVFIYPVSHPLLASLLPSTITSSSSTPSHPAQNDATTPAYLIETSTTRLPALLTHLKRYKLRSKASIHPIPPSDLTIHSLWSSSSRWTAHGTPPTPHLDTHGHPVLALADTRAPGMGSRLILPPSTSPSTLTSTGPPPEPAPESAYHIRRLLRGIPEGPTELPPASALPHESNMDLTGAIDFKKGCYVGQELTIRTQHTGVVRKRVVPVMLYRDGDEAPRGLCYAGGDLADSVRGGANIMPVRAGRSAGRFLAGVGNVGLGLCRVEKMTDLVLTAEGSAFSSGDEFGFRASDLIGGGEGEADTEYRAGESGKAGERDGGGEGGMGKESKEMGPVRVRAFVPDWLRNQIKVRDPQRRV